VEQPLGDCGEAHLVCQFAIDSAFALVRGALLWWVLRRTGDGWRVKLLTDRKPQVVLLPLAAAGADLVVNGLTLAWLRVGGDGPSGRT
jgi:hypothetical protein